MSRKSTFLIDPVSLIVESLLALRIGESADPAPARLLVDSLLSFAGASSSREALARPAPASAAPASAALSR